MTPETLSHNHRNCLLKILQFDLCLISEIFSVFPVLILCSILFVMGVDLLQFLDIWFIKATTEVAFSLTRTKPPSLQVGIGLISQRRFAKNLIQCWYISSKLQRIISIVSLAACLQWHVTNLVSCFQILLCLS